MLTAVQGAVRRASTPNAVLLALHRTKRSCASSPASATAGKGGVSKVSPGTKFNLRALATAVVTTALVNLAGKQVFDTELLASLVCPLSKGDLRYNADKQELVCHEVGVAYPIVAGIPRLMPTAGCLIEPAS